MTFSIILLEPKYFSSSVILLILLSITVYSLIDNCLFFNW